jgi:polysaccharide biosynthesis protein PslH
MRILWVKADFLHPTNRGGQIRTLEMLKWLHRKHEVHYIGMAETGEQEGPDRAGEYSSRHWVIRHSAPSRRSPRFLPYLLGGLVSPVPVAIALRQSREMKERIAQLQQQHRYDCLVCDFLTPAINLPALEDAVLFQHNVEMMIWRRHAEQASNPLARWYFQRQARAMEQFERTVCRSVRQVIGVSETDAATMRQEFGLKQVHWVPTGVDTAYFAPPDQPPSPAPHYSSDLLFLGSMDWMPNIDGVRWFLSDILPLIRAQRPEVRVTICGRRPTPEITRLAAAHPGVTVTGTVDDVRPYLWGARVSIVPLRIGGGTRLKIYEAMASSLPAVSTTIGAEGLTYTDGRHLHIADFPETFAARCLELLQAPDLAAAMGRQARDLVTEHFSWEGISDRFAAILSSQS